MRCLCLSTDIQKISKILFFSLKNIDIKVFILYLIGILLISNFFPTINRKVQILAICYLFD